MSYSGLNPKFNWLNLIPQSADPTSPNEGDVYRSDGTVRPEGIWEYRNSTWQQIGSASDVANLIPAFNSDFEGSLGDWVTYADAASAIPVDGTGGTPTITLTRITTPANVLNGIASARISKDPNNRQGEGVSLDLLNLDNALANRPCKIQFNYATTGLFVNGSSTVNSSIKVFLYDIDNTQIITPFPNWIDGSGRFEGYFQNSNSKNLRLILHIATTETAVWTFTFDNVSVQENDNLNLAADSDWQSYTPIFSNFGTVTSINFQYRKDGPSIHIRGNFISGTPAAGEARISMPTGLLAKSDLPTLSHVGTLVEGQAVAANTYFTLIEPNVNYLTVSGQGDNGLAKLNANGFANSGITYSISAQVPIQSFSSGYITAATTLQNVSAVFTGIKNATQVVTANVTDISFISTKDSVGSWNGSQYTVRVPGDYQVSLTLIDNATTSWSAVTYINGVVQTTKRFSQISGDYGSGSLILENLQVGQVISFRATQSTTIGNVGQLSIAKIESPNALLNIPKVAYLKDVKASGTNGQNLTTSYTTLILNTEEDPFGIVSIASNEFTLQPGTYTIEASIPMTANAVGSYFCKPKLQNITAGTTQIVGSNGQTATENVTRQYGDKCLINGVFSISVPTVFAIQARANSTAVLLGNANAVGDVEVYTQVKLTKIL
jgi:hypothetical protein